MNDLPTAAEARAKMNSLQEIKAQTQIMHVRTNISRAIEQGRGSIDVYQPLMPNVVVHLRELGYRVEDHPALDQRDETSWTVSW